MRTSTLLMIAAVLVGCGGDDASPPGGLQPLVPDPAVITGCAPGPVAAGATRAKPIACAEELIGGRLAGGRIGDLVLVNERVRVIVRGLGEGLYLHGSGGGGIVDAATVGGEDLIKEFLPTVDLAGSAADELVITEAGDDGPAEVVVRGPARALDIITAILAREPPPVVIEHRYRLAAAADAVELTTRVVPVDGPLLQAPVLADALFVGGRVQAFLPGSGWASGVGSAEIIATDGTTTSYGIVYPAGFTDPHIIDLAGIRVIESLPLDEVGITRWLVLGDGSVASVTERGWALRGVALGTASGTTAPGVDVVVADGRGAPITIARADSAGRYRVAVPPAAYVLRAEAIGRVTGPDVAVTVTAGADVVTPLPAGAGGTLAVTAHDGDGAPLPARVLIEQAGADRRIAWTDASGATAVALPPGVWRVSVSRGLEYDAFVASTVTVVDGQTATVAATLDRVVDTAGWISLDTHLHSELSTDSTFPVDDRLRAVAGEGVELPVSTDHDFITDYRPIIAELGLGAWLGAIAGAEVSSVVWGHLNGFPLVPDRQRTGAGAMPWLARSPGAVFAAMRGGDPDRIVQVNHPRDGDNSLFDALELDPTTLTVRRDPVELGLPAGTDLSDLGFDAIEVANAGAAADFEQVFSDWMEMLAAGHRAVATGSSDSHGASAWAGEARTYVWVGTGADDPATVDLGAVTDAIHAGHVVVGTGAFVIAGIVAPTGVSLPGDVVDVTGLPQLLLRIRVQAAPWQPLARIRIYQDGRVAHEIVLDPTDTAVVRYAGDVALPLPTADAFYLVRVDSGGRGDPVQDDALPAFTNPLFAQVTP